MVETPKEFQAFLDSEVGGVRGPKSGSGAPGPKSAPRDNKSTTFAYAFFQASKPQKTNIFGIQLLVGSSAGINLGS